MMNLLDLNDVVAWARKNRPFPSHKTFAEKKCGITYEKCIQKFACPDGEECWFDSEDYWFDCGKGAPTIEELKMVKP